VGTASGRRVVASSEAFSGFWNDSAKALDVAVAVLGPGDAVAPTPDTVAVIVAAAGAERDAIQWLEGHRLPPGLPALVVGTDPGRRTAMQFVARGASDYFALPDDLEIFRSAVVAARNGGRARATAVTRGDGYAFAGIVGESEAIKRELTRVARLLPHRSARALVQIGRAACRERGCG